MPGRAGYDRSGAELGPGYRDTRQAARAAAEVQKLGSPSTFRPRSPPPISLPLGSGSPGVATSQFPEPRRNPLQHPRAQGAEGKDGRGRAIPTPDPSAPAGGQVEGRPQNLQTTELHHDRLLPTPKGTESGTEDQIQTQE